jgi:hypothetical protein
LCEDTGRLSQKAVRRVPAALRESEIRNQLFLDERRQAAFLAWRQDVSQWLFEKRGRASRLAEHLGVSRQRVSQWFFVLHRNVPGWTVQPTLEFLRKESDLAGLETPGKPKTAESPGLDGSADLSTNGIDPDFRLGRAIAFCRFLECNTRN